MRRKFVILICEIAAAYCLTCDEILKMPDDKKLSLQELQTIPPKEVVQCLAHLSRDQLGEQEAAYLWKTLVEFYNGVPNVPDSVLMLLHWVTPALQPDDYSNMTLSNIDVIQNFGLNYNLNKEQMSAISDRVRDDFAGKEPEDFTYYDLTALRQILCTFNRSEIERIHPSAYREAALVIGKLENCDAEVLSGFATLAVQPRAFGSPADWSQDVFKILGVVSEYLPKEIKEKHNIRGQEVDSTTSSRS